MTIIQLAVITVVCFVATAPDGTLHAHKVLSRDPAVASGLMRMELHAFKVVMD